jgi:hypothetical protein
MAWYSHTLAFSISGEQTKVDADPRGMLEGHNGDFEHFVYAPSRNGCLLWRLGCLCELAMNGKSLYLLEDAHLLRGEELHHSASQLEALINEMELNPGLVVEATKEPYQPIMTLYVDGFEPRPTKLVYGDDVLIKDGWVYNYTAEQVLGFLGSSCASQTPCPAADDDGESLLYVFNFLKSHLSLLRLAEQSGKVVVYGETNR